MPASTNVCPDCGEAVPRGRLSCPACGALLASVAGGEARPAANEAPGGVALDDPSVMTPARIQSQSLPKASPDDASISGSAALPDRGPATPMTPSSIRQTASPDASPEGSVPPGTPPPAADTLPGPAPTSLPADAPPDMPSPASTTGTFTIPDRAQTARVLGYATAAGSGLIMFGMLMPMARVVIGAGGGDGLFDTWGLAGPGHILVFLWALAVLAVSVLPTRIPVSIRTGLAGLLLGAFSLGLVWPYIVYGPMGAGIGAFVVAIGAIVLTVAGITSAWRDRHATDERSV
jgi:hypothetical protein